MRPKKTNIIYKWNFHLGIILLFLVVISTSFIVSRYINHMNDAKKHIIIIAHRGASAYEPENTLRSFKRAFELGADMIEFDVRLSRDRHLVIMHDEKVDRTTNGEGLVKDKTVSYVMRLLSGVSAIASWAVHVLSVPSVQIGFVIELK